MRKVKFSLRLAGTRQSSKTFHSALSDIDFFPLSHPKTHSQEQDEPRNYVWQFFDKNGEEQEEQKKILFLIFLPCLQFSSCFLWNLLFDNVLLLVAPHQDSPLGKYVNFAETLDCWDSCHCFYGTTNITCCFLVKQEVMFSNLLRVLGEDYKVELLNRRIIQF